MQPWAVCFLAAAGIMAGCVTLIAKRRSRKRGQYSNVRRPTCRTARQLGFLALFGMLNCCETQPLRESPLFKALNLSPHAGHEQEVVVWIKSAAKSGTTWLSVVVQRLLNAHCIHATPRCAWMVGTHAHMHNSSALAPDATSWTGELDGSRTIFMFRDPRDRAISLSYHALLSAGGGEDEALAVEIKETVEAMGFTQDQLRQASLAGLPFGTVDTVLKNLTVYLKTLAAPEGNIALFQKVAGAPPSFGRTDSSAFRWLLAWLDLEGAVPAPLLMTYEWLSASPLVEARRICHWLGLNVTADQLMVVMQQSTAAAMKSKAGQS